MMMDNPYEGYEEWSEELEGKDQEMEFRFSVGDGAGGPVGLCFSLRGRSPEDALRRLTTFLESYPDDGFDLDLPGPLLGARLYINVRQISGKDIFEKLVLVQAGGSE